MLSQDSMNRQLIANYPDQNPETPLCLQKSAVYPAHSPAAPRDRAALRSESDKRQTILTPRMNRLRAHQQHGGELTEVVKDCREAALDGTPVGRIHCILKVVTQSPHNVRGLIH
jgi:hypothetical protein